MARVLTDDREPWIADAAQVAPDTDELAGIGRVEDVPHDGDHSRHTTGEEHFSASTQGSRSI